MAFCLLVGGSLAARPSKPTPKSSPRTTLRVVMDDNYPPYTFRTAEGVLQGFLVDHWRQWERTTGVHVDLIATDWDSAKRIMAQGRAEVIDTIFKTPERELQFDFTPPYTQLPVSIFAHSSLTGIADTTALQGFEVGVKAGDACIDILRNAGISSLREYPNYDSLIQAAISDQVRVFCLDEPPAQFLLTRAKANHIFHKSFTLYSGEFHRAVKKGDTETMALVRKGFEAIQASEVKALRDKWMGTQMPSFIHSKIWLYGLAGAVLFTILLILWNVSLRRKVRQRTAQLEAEHQRLLENEERFRIISQSTQDVLWDWNIARNSIDRSEALKHLLGYPAQELNRDWPAWFQQLHPEDQPRVEKGLKDASEGTATSWSDEYRIRRADGDYAFVLDRGSIVRSPSGKATRMVGIIQDITEKKRAEEKSVKLQSQLLQAQKMESLGILAGGVAHDMNNVLGAILGMAELGMDCQSAGSRGQHAFDTIILAAERGGKMVKSLLSFARKSPAEERDVDMNAILREEVLLLERTTLSKVNFEMDLAPDLRPIRGDANALTHAFMNLCVNAVDAISEKGTLTLRTRNVDAEWVEVSVEDTGSGMPKLVLEKALDPFFTTKGVGKGTGLGLSMVYSTVKAHQGQMDIQSEPGQGTRVRMRFPVCEVLPQVPAAAATPRAESISGNLSVLLVDDDELIQSTLQAILGVLGHRVTAVLSGEEALAELEAGLQPDVVILDMNMPGLGGTGTLPHLRALRPTVPVLLATGRADQTALDLAEAHPHVALLSKPFGMKELQQYLELLDRR